MARARATCPWSTPLPKAEQLRVAELVHQLQLTFGHMWQAVEAPSRPFSSERLAVATAMLAIFDVIVRTPASDNPTLFTGLLQEDGGEVGVLLRRQPQAEVKVRRERRELLLELRHPVHDKVQILEAEPHTRLCGLVQHPDGRPRLLATHRKLLVPAAPLSRRVVLELLRRIGAGSGDHEDGGGRRRVVRVYLAERGGGG